MDVTDSLLASKALAFSLSFDLDIDRTTITQAYRAAGARAGFDGTTAVFEDLYRFAPFNPASPVIDSTARLATNGQGGTRGPWAGVSDIATKLADDYLKRAVQAPMIVDALNRDRDRGSNSWVISGRHTASGRPILASDPHLPLEARRQRTRSSWTAPAMTYRATAFRVPRSSSSARTGP